MSLNLKIKRTDGDIVGLYQNYLDAEDSQYEADANSRIASLYYQLGQSEWEKQNFQEAITFFEKLEQFPEFSLRDPTLFLIAEGEYQNLDEPTQVPNT